MPKPITGCCEPFHYQGGSGRVHWMHNRGCDRFPRVQVGHEPKRPTSCGWHAWVSDYLTSDICNGASCVAYRLAHVDDEHDRVEVDLGASMPHHPTAWVETV